MAQLADALWQLGLRKGDVVAVQLPNLPEHVIAYFAIAHIGAVMTTLYMPHRAREMETLLGHARARALICLADAGGFPAARTALGLRERLPALQHVIVLDLPPEGALSLQALIEEPGSPAGGEAPVGADPFLLLYTSGTTASPKGVPLSYHTMLSNARLSAPEHGLGADDVLLSAAPFGHLFGLYSLHLALAVGAATLLLPAFTPPALAEAIERGEPTALFAAPAHIAACFKAGLLEGRDLGSLKHVILSGAAVPAALARGLDARLEGGSITQLWGMTETQAGLFTRPGDGIEVAAASAGRPSPGAEARIVDEAGAALAAGAAGELQVRGPLLFPGYYRNPEATRAAFTADGWFRTGDLAEMDAAGNVVIVGRTKELINRGGVKYNLREIEELLDRHPKIAQSAIVPVPDEVLGERACCFAVLAGEDEVDLDELLAYLAEAGVAKTKFPERLEIIPEMPLTPTRKIIKGRLTPAAG